MFVKVIQNWLYILLNTKLDRQYEQITFLILYNYSLGSFNKAFLSSSLKTIMEFYDQYQPLKWPPLLKLADLHLKCSGPGKDNIQGVQCPCCGRYEKIKIKKWWSRNITKDFKAYGGGIPAYFELIKYCAIIFFLLSLIIVIFHIVILERVCSNPDAKCVSLFGIVKVCNSVTIIGILNEQGQNTLSTIFTYLQLGSFIVLILATIGMKLWLSYVNNKKIIKENKVYSQFSLMIKNIPKYYQIEDVRKEIQDLIPEVEICELFFVHPIAQFETKYKQLFDLYYQIKFTEDSIKQERGASQQELKQLVQKYIRLYQEVDGLKKKMYINNGRAIIVFNHIQHKQQIHKLLQIGECSKLIYHMGKLLGQNTKKLHFFTDQIMEPQQIIWKYIGESSVTKTKVRIQTTLIVLGFMIISFGLLYFPIYQVNKAKVQSPHIGTALNIIISLALIVLSVSYRMIILRLMPRRHPSSRDSQSYFIVINTIIFHFLFYVVAPGSYYFFATSIPYNAKLAQLFFAVVLFILMNILVAFIDIRYRIFKGRRNKLLKSFSIWAKFCQIRLNQELKYPSFPIQFKIMVILNIWSFNAFYIFQIPYLLVLFWITLIIMYWVDKKNLYKHYKMQVFLSIQMQQKVQRDFIFFFLLCLCCGYAISINQTWQYYLILVLFILAIITNYLISFKKTGKDLGVEKSMTLSEVVKAQSMNPKQSMMHHIQETQNRQNIIIMNESLSSKSLGTVLYQYGYQQQYQNYLNQFTNKNMNQVMQNAYVQFLRSLSLKGRQSQMAQINQSEKYKTDQVDESTDSVKNELINDQNFKKNQKQ